MKSKLLLSLVIAAGALGLFGMMAMAYGVLRQGGSDFDARMKAALERGTEPTSFQAMVAADEFFDHFLADRDNSLVKRSRAVTAETISIAGKEVAVWAHSSVVSEGKSIDEQGPERVFILYYADSRLVAYKDGESAVTPKSSRRFNFGGAAGSAP